MSKKSAKATRVAADNLMRAYIDSYGYSIWNTQSLPRELQYSTKDDVTGADVAFVGTLNKKGLITRFIYANLGLDLESKQDDLGIRVSVYDPVAFLRELAPVITSRPVITPSNIQDFTYLIDGLAGVSYGSNSTYVQMSGAFEAYA